MHALAQARLQVRVQELGLAEARQQLELCADRNTLGTPCLRSAQTPARRWSAMAAATDRWYSAARHAATLRGRCTRYEQRLTESCIEVLTYPTELSYPAEY